MSEWLGDCAVCGLWPSATWSPSRLWRERGVHGVSLRSPWAPPHPALLRIPPDNVPIVGTWPTSPPNITSTSLEFSRDARGSLLSRHSAGPKQETKAGNTVCRDRTVDKSIISVWNINKMYVFKPQITPFQYAHFSIFRLCSTSVPGKK